MKDDDDEYIETDCAGWEVVCPDGRIRAMPYHNYGDAESHARLGSDPARFARRGNCRLAPNPSQLDQGQPPCPGGVHVVRPIAFYHASFERAKA